MITAHISRQLADSPPKEIQGLPIISINDPESILSKLEHFTDRIYLQFHDIDRDVPNYNGTGKDLKTITDKQAKEIVDFCEKHKSNSIIVHCEAGISRSAAVALFINQSYGHRLIGNPILYNKKVYSMIREAYQNILNDSFCKGA